MEKNYYLVLDVETANSFQCPLVYDLGFAVVDRNGKIYHAESFIVSDIFYQEAEKMKTAYYAKKIPLYLEGIANKLFNVVTFTEAKNRIAEVIKEWKIKEAGAYNMGFDSRALGTTQKYLSKSSIIQFLPEGIKIFCIWHMACQVLCTQKGFVKFCLDNNFISKAGNIKTSAEVVYRYLIKDEQFIESHTGLADVLIEVQIMAKCFAQHKKMSRNVNRACWRIPQKKREVK